MAENLSNLFFEFLKGAHPVKLLFKVLVSEVSSVAILTHVARSLDVFFKEWFDPFEC